MENEAFYFTIGIWSGLFGGLCFTYPPILSVFTNPFDQVKHELKLNMENHSRYKSLK